jgi:hypothetical protein
MGRTILMPRTLDAGLLAAMNAGNFIPYFKVQLMDANRTSVMWETTEIKRFELEGLTAKVSFVDPENYQDFYTFRLVRGVYISSTPNTITSSSFWPLVDRHHKRIRTLEGHVFPNQFYSTAGDVTYSSLISTICTHFGFSVVHETPGAAWLSYKFLPAGRVVRLNDAKYFFTMLRVKYLVFATDMGDDTLYFYQAKASAPSYPSGYTLVTARYINAPGLGSYKTRSFSSIDESDVVHTSGSSTDPIHNLGYLESTASHPARTYFIDTTDWVIQGILPNLKYLDFDPIRVSYDIIGQGLWPARFKEIFDTDLSPSWQWQARILDVFGNTEGGSVPSTLESVVTYSPLNTSQFDHILSSSDNNIQTAFNTLDNHVHADYIKHSLATAASDFLVASGAGAFIKKTLAEVKTLLGLYRSFIPFVTYTDLIPLTDDELRPFSATIDRTCTLVQWSQSVRVSTTNNSSNYWNIKMIKCTAGTVLEEINTKSISANTNALLTSTSFDVASVGSADVGLYIEVYKTGSPGALFLFSPLLEVTL